MGKALGLTAAWGEDEASQMGGKGLGKERGTHHLILG